MKNKSKTKADAKRFLNETYQKSEESQKLLDIYKHQHADTLKREFSRQYDEMTDIKSLLRRSAPSPFSSNIEKLSKQITELNKIVTAKKGGQNE